MHCIYIRLVQQIPIRTVVTKNLKMSCSPSFALFSAIAHRNFKVCPQQNWNRMCNIEHVCSADVLHKEHKNATERNFEYLEVVFVMPEISPNRLFSIDFVIQPLQSGRAKDDVDFEVVRVFLHAYIYFIGRYMISIWIHKCRRHTLSRCMSLGMFV